MRPVGEIRVAALAVARDLQRAQPERRGFAAREFAAQLIPLGIAREAVRYTMDNLARCGALQKVGARPVQLYALPPETVHAAPSGGDACRALASLLHTWHR